jgi:hypothetical protein
MQILKDQFTNKEKLKKDLICYKHLNAEFIWPYKLKPFTSTDTFDRVFRLTGCVTPSSQDEPLQTQSKLIQVCFSFS